MIRDLSYGIRMLWRTPAFTAIAVLTIALGIAGNTAIFSAIDEQVLRNLPVPHPEELVELRPTGLHDSFPIPTFEYLRDHSIGFAGVFATDGGRASITVDGQSDFVANRFVSGNFESVMGLTPVLGRGFTPEDEVALPAKSFLARVELVECALQLFQLLPSFAELTFRR